MCCCQVCGQDSGGVVTDPWLEYGLMMRFRWNAVDFGLLDRHGRRTLLSLKSEASTRLEVELWDKQREDME